MVPGGPTRRPRLLVLASTFPRADGDGTPGFVADLAREQARAFETLVLVPRVPGAPAEEARDGYRIRRFAYFPRRWEDLADGAMLENVRRRRSRLLQVLPFFAAEAVAVRRAVREFDPDVLHVHWMIPQGLAALAAARGRPRLVTTLGGDLYALRSWPWRLLKRAVLRKADAASVMNREMADKMVALGVERSRIHVQPMGANVARVRSNAGGAPVPGRMIFVGRLVEKKGLAVLLDALGIIGPGLTWSLDVIGDGPLRADLEARATGLGDRVRFHGQRSADAVAAMLYDAEVAVFPSVPARSGDQDGLPVALLEAMTAGRAVVATSIAGIDEAIEDGIHGLLVPPGDVAALVSALRRVLADNSLRADLGAAATHRADDYSIEAVGAAYVTLLSSLLDSDDVLTA